MPVPRKWKVVGGSVSAAVLLGSGIAAADLGDAPGRIALDEQAEASEIVVATVAEARSTLLATIQAELAADDAGTQDPSDDPSGSRPDDGESVDSPDDSVQSPDESVDSPDGEDPVESPDESVDSPDGEDPVESPDESVDSPDESVDSPDEDPDAS